MMEGNDVGAEQQALCYTMIVMYVQVVAVLLKYNTLLFPVPGKTIPDVGHIHAL